MKGLLTNTGGLMAFSLLPRHQMSTNAQQLYTYTPGLTFDIELLPGEDSILYGRYIVVAAIGPYAFGAYAPDQFNRLKPSSKGALELLTKISGFDNSQIKFYIDSVDWQAHDLDELTEVKTKKRYAEEYWGTPPNVGVITGIKANGSPSSIFAQRKLELQSDIETSKTKWSDYIFQLFKVKEVNDVITYNYSGEEYAALRNNWSTFSTNLTVPQTNATNAINNGTKTLNEFLLNAEGLELLEPYIKDIKEHGRAGLFWHAYFYPDTLSQEYKNELFDITKTDFDLVYPNRSFDTPTIIPPGSLAVYKPLSNNGLLANKSNYAGLGANGTYLYKHDFVTYPDKAKFNISDTIVPSYSEAPTYSWGGITNYYDVNSIYMPGISNTCEMRLDSPPVQGVVSGVDLAIYETNNDIIKTGFTFAGNIVSMFLASFNSSKKSKNGRFQSLTAALSSVVDMAVNYANIAQTEHTQGAGTYLDSLSSRSDTPHYNISFLNVSDSINYRQKRYGFTDEKTGRSNRIKYYNIPINKIYDEVAVDNDRGSVNFGLTQLNKDVWENVDTYLYSNPVSKSSASIYIGPHFIHGRFTISILYEKYFWMLLNKQNRGTI